MAGPADAAIHAVGIIVHPSLWPYGPGACPRRAVAYIR